MKRKLLSVLLALCMVLTLMAAPVAAAYQDTEGHWAESSIERWTGHGIVQGTENGFDPDGELTCAQLAAILARLLKLPEAPDAGFRDNPAEAWYFDSVNRCAAAGILLGNGDGTVTPNAPITRERAIVMLSRALGIKPIENPDLSAFEDADAVADYAQGYVAALVAAGVIKGVTDETVGPQLNITRAATVAILDRAIAVYADTEGAEIDASEGGFILVAAENVVIKNAPTGTKVLVPPSADGLTVNGKKVESDQTYVVPENKPVTPVHSHSYDETTHKCSCGSFDPAVVATIGDEVGYLTLKDAVAAAQSGDTVKLVKDIVISPAVSDEDKTVSKLVAQLTVDTDVVLDMNGKKLSVTEGDFGKASPLLIAVTAGTLTIKGNGEINCEAGENQVYGINVNGGKVVVEDGTFYGAMTAIQVQKGELVIKDGTFDMAPTCKAMVPQYAKYIVNAIDSAWKNGTAKISIFGGTFGFDPSNTPEGAESTYLADGYQATETAEGSGFWTVTEAKNASFAAEVGGVKYTTLAKAIAAVENGDTVTLVDDTDISAAGLNIQKNMTIDLKGHTIKAATARVGNIRVSNAKLVLMDSTDTDKNGTGKGKIIAATDYEYGVSDLPVIYVEDGELVMESGYVETVTKDPTENGQFALGVYNTNASASITINGGHIKAGWYCVSGNGGNATHEGEIIINGGILESVADYALYLPHKGTTTINGGTIYGAAGGVTIMRGTLKVNGGTITSKGTGSTGTWGDGTGGLEAAAVNVEAKYGTSTVEIAGGTFIAETKALFIKNSTNDGSISLTGGTFSSDPSAYVAAGYIAKETSEGSGTRWTVGEKTNVTLVAQVGLNKYESLADALTAAKDGDTVKLVSNIQTGEGIEVAKKITLDMAEHTITSSVNQVFTVTDSGDLTITGNGTIAGPTGEAAINLDSKAVLMVSGESAKLTVLNGTITAGGVGDCGMYGIYVADGGNVILGDAGTKTGPTITTWFAAVGENNTTSPANITIYGGEYTAQAAPAESDWWAYFCAPVYASASGNITISGGTFNGYYGISSRYVNVGQNLNISGGTFNGSKSALFVDTQTGTACDEMRTIAITGGRFSSKPDNSYIAAGYEATENNDGTWTVA